MQPVPLCDCGKPRRKLLYKKNGHNATCGEVACISARHREANLKRVNTQATREKMSRSALKRYENHAHKNNYRVPSRVLGEKMPRAHRIVMEEKIMRLLKPTEIVHHWDENKRNNDPDNLALLRSTTAHMRLHGFARRHGLPVAALKFDQPWLDYEYPIE